MHSCTGAVATQPRQEFKGRFCRRGANTRGVHPSPSHYTGISRKAMNDGWKMNRTLLTTLGCGEGTDDISIGLIRMYV